MRGSMNDLPPSLTLPEGKLWQVEWGGTTVEIGHFHKRMDQAPLFAGLPDDQCQCPHWGYVVKGTLRYRYKDREEVFGPGDIYYAPPGHTPVMEAGVEYVEFSPTHELGKTMEVVEQNFAAIRSDA
jgi:hypothetical protein